MFQQSPKLAAYTDAQRILDDLGDDTVQGFRQMRTPKLVFIGMQSHGKSSTVETLVGVEMLPKGRDTVTKCPLEIKLLARAEPHSTLGDLDWAKLSYKDQDTGESMVISVAAHDISKTIMEISAVIAPDKDDLSEKPILMDLHVKGAAPLSFVDLPGLLFDSTRQHSGKKVADFIEEMWRKYAEPEESTIVLVASATEDYRANKAYEIVKALDASGKRTLIVLTKLDKVEGNNVEIMLQDENATKTAKLGVIGVINRSDKDLSTKMTMQQALKKEDDWLKENLPKAMAAKQGSRKLAETLGQILWERIKEALPKISLEIEKRLNVYKSEQDILGPQQDLSENLKLAVDITLGYVEVYRFAITGRRENEGDGHIKTKDRKTSANDIRWLFEFDLPKQLEALNFALQDEDFRIIIGNLEGISRKTTRVDFMEKTLREIVRSMQTNFIPITQICVDEVYDLMAAEITDCILLHDNLEIMFRRLPNLRDHLMDITREKLTKLKESAADIAKTLSLTDASYISGEEVRDKAAEIISKREAAEKVTTTPVPDSSSSDCCVGRLVPEVEPSLLADMKELAAQFMETVREKMRVTIVQSVTENLINSMCKTLSRTLFHDWVPGVSCQDECSFFFTEDGATKQRREELLTIIKRYKDARTMLNRLFDLHSNDRYAKLSMPAQSAHRTYSAVISASYASDETNNDRGSCPLA